MRKLLFLPLILFFVIPGRAVGSNVVVDTTITHAHLAQDRFPENTGREGKMNTLAVVGLVFSVLIPPVGIALSLIALHQMKKRHERGRGIALAGLIVGISLCGLFIIGSTLYIFSHAYR